MYKLAEDCLAYYPAQGSAIHYVGNNLHVDLWFESFGQARTFLSKFGEMSDRHISFALIAFCEKPSIIEITVSERAKPVYKSDYKSGDNKESPDISLRDFASLPNSDILEYSEGLQYLAVESHEAVRAFGSNFYRCHLIGKTETHKYVNNEDNYLYASWNFHQLFDNLNTYRKEIGVVIKFEKYIGRDQVLIGDQYEERDVINVLVKFRNADQGSVFFKTVLKNGTEMVDQFTYRSVLYPRNHAIMKTCLDIKYKNCYWGDEPNEAENDVFINSW
jgi:hypothetical protein